MPGLLRAEAEPFEEGAGVAILGLLREKLLCTQWS